MRKMLKEQKVTDKRERKAAQKSMKALKKMQVKGLSDSTNTADSTADGRSTPKLYAAEELGADATPMRVKHNPLRRPSLMDENVDGTNEGPLSPAAPKGVAARNGGKWKSKSAWCTVQGEGCRLQCIHRAVQGGAAALFARRLHACTRRENAPTPRETGRCDSSTARD